MTAARKKPTDETETCAWCSATVPAGSARCPSCGATLRDAANGEILGVTQIDHAAASRLARLKPPGRLAMWLGAERTTDNPELSGTIEPPSEAVKREMLQLELAAIDAEIEAKRLQADAERRLASDAASDQAPPDEPSDGAPAARPPDAAGEAETG